MTDATSAVVEEAPKGGKKPLIIGLLLALLGGGGGFYAVSSGLILAPESEAVEETPAPEIGAFSDVSFIPIDPISVSLPKESAYKHLRFRAELEVKSNAYEEVKKVLPRVVDVLNSYLRSLAVSDIEEPASLTRLRSQMLRRVQIVSGPKKVNDLLIMEFVLN